MPFLPVAGAVILGLWVATIAALFLLGRHSIAREVAAFLPNLGRLMWGLARDPRVPLGSRVLLVFAAVWIASPIDLIPEFIPVVGPLDDAIVAGLVLRWVLRRTGREVIADHWRGDRATLERLLRVFRI